MPVPVLTVAQMREWEELSWRARKSVDTVMGLAGAALARQALAMTRPHDAILLLAGKGNNGGDTKRAIEHLVERQVRLLEITEPEMAHDDLAVQLAAKPALVVDGLFGIGLNRPLQKGWVEMVRQLNESALPVLAVDVPSGLCADTGAPLGVAVRARATLTFGAPKAGCLSPAAAQQVGRLLVAEDIGLIACPHTADSYWTVPSDFAGTPPPRAADAHKGSFGHVGIMAGSLGYHGAAVLAARGALAARPGLVTVLTPENVYVSVASQLQSAMVHPWSAAAAQHLQHCTAFVMGPGLASPDIPENFKSAAAELWQHSPKPVVADASALDWLPLTNVSTPHGAVRVITPHPGEAARLLNMTAQAVQLDRQQTLRKLSAMLPSAWIVLKGQHTLIATADTPVWINSSGNPMLAQGGSGDVLAGLLGGYLAQPWAQRDPVTAIRFAVWRHGHAADCLSASRESWGMDELIGQL